MNDSTPKMFTCKDTDLGPAGSITSTVMFGNRAVGRCIHDFRGDDTFLIPDVDAETEGEDSPSLAAGTKFFAKYKAFADEGEAYDYVKSNFARVAYLFKYGDFD